VKWQTIRPPRGKPFLRRFTRLASDPDQIRKFADRFGPLVNPLGDHLGLWGQEIAEVRDLADTLDEAAEVLHYDRSAMRALSRRFTLRTYAEVLEEGALKVAYLRHAALARRVMVSPQFDDRLVVYAYGTRTAPWSWAAAEAFGYRELAPITDGKALVAATRALVRFARTCVQEAIERRLWGAHIGVIYDYGKSAPQPPSIVPATLRGAIYLELDRKLRSPSLPPRECAQCGALIGPLRRTRKFCGPTCRKAAWRLGHPDVAKEESA
jgi:hypothetical protein